MLTKTINSSLVCAEEGEITLSLLKTQSKRIKRRSFVNRDPSSTRAGQRMMRESRAEPYTHTHIHTYNGKKDIEETGGVVPLACSGGGEGGGSRRPEFLKEKIVAFARTFSLG